MPRLAKTDNWTHAFAYTGGAAWTQWRETTGSALLARLFIEFNTIVVRDGIDPQVAHAAFLTIDEYADTVAKDVPGEGSFVAARPGTHGTARADLKG